MSDANNTKGGMPTKLIVVIENRMLREAITALLQKQSDLSIEASIRYSASA